MLDSDIISQNVKNLLPKHYTVFISAAVTGKIDVREVEQ